MLEKYKLKPSYEEAGKYAADSLDKKYATDCSHRYCVDLGNDHFCTISSRAYRGI